MKACLGLWRGRDLSPADWLMSECGIGDGSKTAEGSLGFEGRLLFARGAVFAVCVDWESFRGVVIDRRGVQGSTAQIRDNVL